MISTVTKASHGYVWILPRNGLSMTALESEELYFDIRTGLGEGETGSADLVTPIGGAGLDWPARRVLLCPSLL